MHLTIDFESRSPIDIKKCGGHVYAEHPDTEVMCLAVKVDDEPTRIWTPEQFAHWMEGDLGEIELRSLVRRAEVVAAHNAAGFERPVWSEHMVRRRGFPEIEIERWDDTAARAAMCGLPRSLDAAVKALGLPVQKDLDGHKLMLKLSKPRVPRKAERQELAETLGWSGEWAETAAGQEAKEILDRLKIDPRAPESLPLNYREFIKYHGNAEMYAALCAYCVQDVEAERALHHALPPLPAAERRLWNLDQIISDRGIRADVESAEHAQAIIEQHERALLGELADLTGGEVKSVKAVASLKGWLARQGVEVDDLTKNSVGDALKIDLPPHARRVLEIRQSLGRSSTAKLDSLRAGTCRDGRIHGSVVYHGAATGRWTGKGFQPHNLPRGDERLDPESIIETLFPLRNAGLVADIWGDPMSAVSTCLRGLIHAAPGHDLIAADYSAIEGRGLAWLAGEQHVLDAYVEGKDLYKVAASGIYKIPYEAVDGGGKGKQRQVGKVAELACLGPNTQVVTDSGVKDITEVTISDKLWDGTEWVNHGGLIRRGLRATINLCGVEVTPDHLIKTKETWTQAQQLASSESTLCQALEIALANSPSSESSAKKQALVRATWCGSSVLAALNRIWSSTTISGKADLPVAICAPRSKQGGIVKTSSNTRKPAPTTRTGDACLTAWPRAKTGVTIQTTGTTETTGVEESTCTTLGERISALFSRMSCSLTAGTTRLLNWTASTWTKAMSRGISGSYLVAKMWPTRDRSRKCRSESPLLRPTFDILNAGSRNCFTILSDRGPLIVHNCGYQGGWRAMLAFGADRMGMTEEEMQAAVAGWRESRPATVRLWKALEEAALVCVRDKVQTKYRALRFRLHGKFLQLVLPSGRPLWYYAPRATPTKTPWGQEKLMVTAMTVDGMTKQWLRRPYHGGLWAENATQAFCRDILARGLLRCEEAGYRPVLHVHDEIVAEVPEGFGSVEDMERIMSETPPWAEGMPIAASGFRGKRYRK